MGKGGYFEREIARILSLWWTDGDRDDIFYRSHSSGARFTQRKKSGKDTALQGGDITASDPIGEPLIKAWSIEVKTGYGTPTKSGINRWDVLDFIDSQQKKPVLEKMWNQSDRDAKLTSREPVLIFRRNGRIPCIMFRSMYILKLRDLFGDNMGFHIIVRTTFNTVLMSLSDFMEWIPDIRSALCFDQSESKDSKATKKQILISRQE